MGRGSCRASFVVRKRTTARRNGDENSVWVISIGYGMRIGGRGLGPDNPGDRAITMVGAGHPMVKGASRARAGTLAVVGVPMGRVRVRISVAAGTNRSRMNTKEVT